MFKYKKIKTEDDLSFPVNQVYLINNKTYFVSMDRKTKAILAGDYDKELLCFYPEYFEYLISTNYVKLMNNGEVVDNFKPTNMTF